MSSIFIVLMRRWGNLEGHTYIAGTAETLPVAEELAKEEAYQRGGKYEYQIFRCHDRSLIKVATTCHMDRVIPGHLEAVALLNQQGLS